MKMETSLQQAEPLEVEQNKARKIETETCLRSERFQVLRKPKQHRLNGDKSTTSRAERLKMLSEPKLQRLGWR